MREFFDQVRSFLRRLWDRFFQRAEKPRVEEPVIVRPRPAATHPRQKPRGVNGGCSAWLRAWPTAGVRIRHGRQRGPAQ